MPIKLALDEQEIHISMNASNPKLWEVYTDYPKWQRKLEKIGAKLIKDDGVGKHYTLDSTQVSVKAKRKPMSAEARAAVAERLAKGRETRTD